MKQYIVTHGGRVSEATDSWAEKKAANIAGCPFAESERHALQLTFAPNGERFISVTGSYTAHCCFEGSVLDIHAADGPNVVCETMEEADAVVIAAALNARGDLQP